MYKIVLFFVASCLIACGGARAAAPKTTNPPIVAPEAATPAPPKVDGPLLLKFSELGCSMTLPSHRWKHQLIQNDDGTSFMKIDLEGTSVILFLQPYANPLSVALKDVIDVERLKFLGQAGQNVSDVRDDGASRWAFTVDVLGPDNKAIKGLMYTVPVPNRTDVYLSMAVIGLSDEVDAHIIEAHGIIESLKPLPQ